MSGDYAHKVVLSLIAQTCQYVGWTAATKSSLDIFSDVFERYVNNFGKTIKAYTELGNRTYPLQEDFSLTLEALGISVDELDEYITDVPSFPFVKNVPTFPLHKANNLQIPDIKDLLLENRPDYIPDYYPLLITKQNHPARQESQILSKESDVEEHKSGFLDSTTNGEQSEKNQNQDGKQLHKNLLKNNVAIMCTTDEVKEIKACKGLPTNLLKHLSSSCSESEDEVLDTKIITPKSPPNVTEKYQSPLKNVNKNCQMTPSKRKVGRPKKQEESPTKYSNVPVAENSLLDEENLNIKAEKTNFAKEDSIMKTKSSIVDLKKNEGKKKTSKEIVNPITSTSVNGSKTISQSSHYNTLENELFSSPIILPKLKVKEEPIVKSSISQEMPLTTNKSNKKPLTKVAPLTSSFNKKDVHTTVRKDKSGIDNKEKSLFTTSPTQISIKTEFQQPPAEDTSTDIPKTTAKSQYPPSPRTDQATNLDKDSGKVEKFTTDMAKGFLGIMSKGKKRKKIALSSRKVKKPFLNSRKSFKTEVEISAVSRGEYREDVKLETAVEEASIHCPSTPTLTEAKGVLDSPIHSAGISNERDIDEESRVASPTNKEAFFDDIHSEESEKAPSTSTSDGHSDNGDHAIKYEITTPTPSYSANHVTPSGGPIKIKIFKRPPQALAAPPQPAPPLTRPPPIYTPSGESSDEGNDPPIAALSRDFEAPPPPIVGYGLSNFIDHVTDGAELFRRSAAVAMTTMTSSSVTPSTSPPSSSGGRLDEVNLLRRRKMTKKCKPPPPAPSPSARYEDGKYQNFQTPPSPHTAFSLAPKVTTASPRAKFKPAKKRKKHPPYHHRISGPGREEEESLEYIPAKKRRQSIDGVDESSTFFGSSRPSSLPPSSTKEITTLLTPIHSDKMATPVKSSGKKGKKHTSPSPLLPLEQSLGSSQPMHSPDPSPLSGAGVQRTVFTETLGSAVVSDNGEKIWICPACTHPDDGSPMIGCDNCDDWYHWVCVNITEPPDENENWYCTRCLAKRLTSKKKKRKKR